MSIVFLVIAAAGFGFFGFKQFKKNLFEVKIKNLEEKNSLTRGWNYFSNLIWASYIIVFAMGLIVNNLIFV